MLHTNWTQKERDEPGVCVDKMSAPPPPHALPPPPPPPLHHVTVVRLLDAAMSAETPSRKAFFSVQITTKSNAKNYVAKCRNSHSGGGSSNSGGSSSSRNGASTKEKKKNANDADPAPNAIEYESIFRVKRRFPDDFVSFRKQLRAAFPGCVVPKIFRRRRRRRKKSCGRRMTSASASASASAPPWNTDDDDDDDENNDSTNDNERYTFGNDDKDDAANDGSRATWSFATTVTTSGGRCGNDWSLSSSELEHDAELFLRRCCESPTIAASKMLETFLTEGVFVAASTTSSAGTSTSFEAEGELKEGFWNALAEDADVRAVKEEQEKRGRFSPSAWFASLFSNGGRSGGNTGRSGSNGGGAKERKYTRTRHSVLKDEDPAYLQVITYASKLDEQCDAFVRSAESYINQLERELNATKLRELGEAALKMGQSEEGWGKSLQRRSKNYSLGNTLHAFSDCAQSMTFMETASDLKACEAVRALIPCFEDCRQRVEAIRETFEDRTTALLHYQIACDVYDEVIEMHGRAMANIHQECLEADAKRENRRKVYDLIVERMREEYPRWHASIGADMTHSLRAFAKTRAALCRRDAECWEMMLRDPIGGDDVKMDDVMRVDDRHEEHGLEVVSRYDDHVKPRGKLLSTKEKLLLEKNARRIQRVEKRREKEEREILRAWKKEAKMAIANGQSVPEMPAEYYEKKMRNKNDKKKSADSDDDAENRNEENKKNDEGGKDDGEIFISSSRDTTRIVSSSSSSSAVAATSSLSSLSSSSSSSMPLSAATMATKTTSSSLLNSIGETTTLESGASVKIVSDVAKYSSNSTRADEQQREKQNEEKQSQKLLLSRPPPEPLEAVKTDEASISEKLAAVKMAAAAENDDDSEWSD